MSVKLFGLGHLHQLDVGVPLLPAPDDGYGAIGAPAVGQDHLQALQRVVEGRQVGEGLIHGPLGVAHRGDYRNVRLVVHVGESPCYAS